jgi:hypothetical protein
MLKTITHVRWQHEYNASRRTRRYRCLLGADFAPCNLRGALCGATALLCQRQEPRLHLGRVVIGCRIVHSQTEAAARSKVLWQSAGEAAL